MQFYKKDYQVLRFFKLTGYGLALVNLAKINFYQIQQTSGGLK